MIKYKSYKTFYYGKKSKESRLKGYNFKSYESASTKRPSSCPSPIISV